MARAFSHCVNDNKRRELEIPPEDPALRHEYPDSESSQSRMFKMKYRELNARAARN
jgi:hypothetical protein